MGGGESFDAGVVTEKLTHLKQEIFGINRDIAIVILHHLRKVKEGDEPGFNDVANSFAMTAAPDSNMILWDPKIATDPNLRCIKVQGRYGLVPNRSIRLTKDGYEFVAKDDAERIKSKTPLLTKIIKILQENPKLYANGITRQACVAVLRNDFGIKTSVGTVQKAVKQLELAEDDARRN